MDLSRIPRTGPLRTPVHFPASCGPRGEDHRRRDAGVLSLDWRQVAGCGAAAPFPRDGLTRSSSQLANVYLWGLPGAPAELAVAVPRTLLQRAVVCDTVYREGPTPGPQYVL